MVLNTIADDGPGIAPEDQERMFKIFQAVNPQNRSDSTGIGLAIVKKIIEAEGGTIWLESEIGNGTTFYFTWPKCLGRPNTSTLGTR
jgi:signal transduction histidine kinase